MTTATQRAELDPATPMAGIGMALCAFAMFTAMGTCSKLLGGRYHVLQVMFLNSLLARAAGGSSAAASTCCATRPEAEAAGMSGGPTPAEILS